MKHSWTKTFQLLVPGFFEFFVLANHCHFNLKQLVTYTNAMEILLEEIFLYWFFLTL